MSDPRSGPGALELPIFLHEIKVSFGRFFFVCSFISRLDETMPNQHLPALNSNFTAMIAIPLQDSFLPRVKSAQGHSGSDGLKS